ncbi:MAG TPA: DUF1573 domain-containing protein [Bacteroidota bacterium]|jgi:hypothetical protein|nr:DUF1573 domain-containing protein [Bacteroidota bacterium]
MLCAPLHFVSAQPRLSLVGGTTPDFGVIYTPSIERLITLRNVGTDTLTISGVSTSCGCTAALVSNDHIAPGDSGILSVKFDAKSYSGKVEKLVSLNTNDTTQKHVNIKFAATVIKSLDFEPEYFFFSTTIDSLTEKTIAITNSSSQTIHILSVKPSSELVSLKLSEDKLEPGEESSLSCTIRPTEPGTVRGNIEILTDFREHPKLSISYFAYTKAKKIKLN